MAVRDAGRVKWVMVQDGEISKEQRSYGFWYFIPRYALGREPLCPCSVGESGRSEYSCATLGD
jgi:hypothetical protein